MRLISSLVPRPHYPSVETGLAQCKIKTFWYVNEYMNGCKLNWLVPVNMWGTIPLQFIYRGRLLSFTSFNTFG